MEAKEVRELLSRGETQNCDFKGACKWDAEDRARLCKTIVSMANTRDGGIILVGINDDRSTGVPSIEGLSSEQLLSFDPTKVGQYVNSHFSPDVRVRVEKHELDGKHVALIVITEFDTEPHICTKEATFEGRQQFKSGDLLVRTAAAESRLVTHKELRELIGRATTKRGDHLLEQMRAILTGKAPAPEPFVPPDAAIAVLDRSRSEALKKFASDGRRGGWSFRMFPKRPSSISARTHGDLVELVRSSRVDLRGWSMVPVDGGIQNFADHIHSSVSYSEGEQWDLFSRLIFGDIRPHFEDLGFYGGSGRPLGSVIAFQNISQSIAEFLLFTKRLLNAAEYEGDVEISISILGCKDRELIAPGRHMVHVRKSSEDSIELGGITSTTELASARQELALRSTLRALALFNWNDPPTDTILKDIADLETRAR